MNFPAYFELEPRTIVEGEFVLPGSKSISNRVLLLAALAQGRTSIHHLLLSEDTEMMLSALSMLGVDIRFEEDVCVIQGCSQQFSNHRAELFLGNAGTAMRPLVAVLACMQGHYELLGVPRMYERPITDLVDALHFLGAQIEYTGQVGFPPLQISPAQLNAGTVSIAGTVSSQFISALLLAAPLIAKQQALTINLTGTLISEPYIAMTIRLMKDFGVHVERSSASEFFIAKGQYYQSPQTFFVEGDASSASYFLAAAVITGGTVRVVGVGKESIQGDLRFVDALKMMGAEVVVEEQSIQVLASNNNLQAIDIDCGLIPDAAMTLAVLALYAEGTTTLRNIASWRVKETDRIFAMATELRKLGAKVTYTESSLTITPPAHINSASIGTYDDHRMAMCFSLACLGRPQKPGALIRINKPECVRKTFPDYFLWFNRICHS